jgi:hypothetical protein
VQIGGAVVEEEDFLEIYTALIRDVDADVAVSARSIGDCFLNHVGEVMAKVSYVNSDLDFLPVQRKELFANLAAYPGQSVRFSLETTPILYEIRS